MQTTAAITAGIAARASALGSAVGASTTFRPGLARGIPLAALAGVAAATAVDLAVARGGTPQAQADVLVRALTVAAAVGVAWALWWRRPAIAPGPLLGLVGVGLALSTLMLSSDPLAFAIGRIVVATLWVLLAYACLMASRRGIERAGPWRPGVMVLLSMALWALLVVLVEQGPDGPLAGCDPLCSEAHPGAPLAASALSVAALAVIVAACLATALVLVGRMRGGSPRERGMTSPGIVATTALILTGAAAALLGQLGVDGAAVELVAGAGIAAAIALPACLFVSYIRSRMVVGAAARRLIARLAAERPTPARVREVLAETLDDPTLELAFWLPSRGRYVDARGSLVDVAAVAPDRAVTYIGSGTPMAAIIHDPALAGHEHLLDTARDAALMSLDNARLDANLRATIRDLSASRRRLLAVADAERRRLERDLHDGAQQSLIALIMDIARAAERRHDDAEMCATFDDLSHAAELALDGLRELVHGLYPTLLTDCGIADALGAAASASPMNVRLDAGGLGRFPADVEVAVYFCCVEALQNAGKHAGRDARVHIAVRRDGHSVAFEVRDDGRGFDVHARGGAGGLMNMHDRIAAAGGQMKIESSVGRGTTVSGSVPLPAVAEPRV